MVGAKVRYASRVLEVTATWEASAMDGIEADRAGNTRVDLYRTSRSIGFPPTSATLYLVI